MHKLTLYFLLFFISVFFMDVKVFSQDPSFCRIIENNYILDSGSVKSCHSSTLVELNDSTIMAAWFAGDYEGASNVNIYTSKFIKNGWTVPKCAAIGYGKDSARFACWNPVLFKNSNGKLFLFYKVGPNPREWWGMMKSSLDDGTTWSEGEKLPKGMLGPIKNKPIQQASGTIIYPSSTESIEGNIWKIHLEISDSNALNWRRIEINNDSFSLIQPAILSHSDNRLQMLCRSRQNRIVEIWSKDGGLSWSIPQAIELPNPNSGIDAVSLKDGRQLLVYNPMMAGKDWWLGRSELRLAISDDGVHWKDIFILEIHESGEYSYPSIIQDSKGIIHISYTDNRKNIKYIKLKLESF